jgi:hypothetical protein
MKELREVIGIDSPDGQGQMVIYPGKLYADDHWLVKKYPDRFVEYAPEMADDVEPKKDPATSKVVKRGKVEQATAEPGEERNVAPRKFGTVT